jgi:[acyl-carrier-protein] S-malonyltransferase
MQEAVPIGDGAMAAILGLEDQAVIKVCAQAAQGRVVEAVNFNSPGQVVIAGHQDAVARAADAAKEAGAKRAMLLSVSVPSHCALMKPAAEKLAVALAAINFKTPLVPIISNVDVRVYLTADEIRDGLQRQLYSPVRWVETIRYLVANGTTSIVECGPGKVLMGLTKRINNEVQNACIDTPVHLEAALALK